MERNPRKWNCEQLKEAVANSISYAEVIKKLGLKLRPGNYTTVQNYIKKHNVSTKHFLGKAHGKSIPKTKIPNKNLFVENSYASRKEIKRRIIKENIIPYCCAICNCVEWNKKPLILVLDHINGINNDNRLENLRFLCPNCNSQEPTFCRGHNPAKLI